MKIVKWFLLSLMLATIVGCGSEAPAVVSAEDQQKAIAEYDAAIYEAESKNVGP